MTDKKKYTTESVRVDKKIKARVQDQLVGQETIGGFYDRAAKEKLEREAGGEKAQYDNRFNRLK